VLRCIVIVLFPRADVKNVQCPPPSSIDWT
jgi:hypothetical protein